MAKLLEYPKIQKLTLDELKTINAAPYKSGLKIINKENKTLQELYTSTINKDVNELWTKGGKKYKSEDIYNYAQAFSFRRDFQTRYASYQYLFKVGYDDKMYNNALIESRFNAIKSQQ
jgi:hypothetical protein